MTGRESPQGQYMDKPLPRDYNQEPEREQGWKLNQEEVVKQWKKLPRLKMSSKQLNTVKWVVIVLVLAVVLIKFIGYMNGPKRMAASFFKAEIADGDSGKLYDMQDLPDGKFLTKEMFLKVYAQPEGQDVTNYEVVSDGTAKVSSGDSYFYNEEEGEELDFIANYSVYYTVKGESSLQKRSYQLIRQSGAFGGLFAQWKVSASDIVAKRVRIYAPESVQLTLDGVALGEEELADSGNYGENYRCYQMDLFAGTHEIYAEANYMEPQNFEVTFYGSGDSYEVPMLSLSSAAQETMQQTMIDLLNDVYELSYNQGDITELLDNFTNDGADQLFYIYYDDIYGSMHETGMTLGNLEFSNFGSTLQDCYISEGRMMARMELNYHYDYDYTYIYNSWFSGDETRTAEESSDSSMYVTFVLEDDMWKIDDLTMYSIY
ncbi:MAG: hypothetical protein Q4C58_05025 [Eubacteriales bacterium]|nr:hypothetical protein [Eubacteriales bacterium]